MQIEDLRFGPDGLLPVIIQDATTNAVLTLAYANREAVERTIAERATFLYSRSRGTLWEKGSTSGNTQAVVAVAYDCDADALLYRVVPVGPACHTGTTSCFGDRMLLREEGTRPAAGEFERAVQHLAKVIETRRSADPSGSYVAKLLVGGVDLIGKKIGEEATEVVIAAKNSTRSEIVWEVADLLFHTLVMLAATGVSPDEVGAELLRRAK